MAWHLTVSKQISAISAVTSTISVFTPVGAMRFLMSLMFFSSGWPTFAENAFTFTPASRSTQQMVFESSPPDTHTPTVLPFKSSNFILFSSLTLLWKSIFETNLHRRCRLSNNANYTIFRLMRVCARHMARTAAISTATTSAITTGMDSFMPNA